MLMSFVCGLLVLIGKKDVKCTMASFSQTAVTYRKLRALFRFLLSNLVDFNPSSQSVPFQELTLLDRCVLALLNDTCHTVWEDLAKFSLSSATNALLLFTNFLGSFYFERVKLCLYFSPADCHSRRAVQTTLHLLLTTLVVYLAPVLSFMAEEVFHAFSPGTSESVHLQPVPTRSYNWEDVATSMSSPFKFTGDQVKRTWEELLKVRQLVNVQMESGRAKGEFNDSFETHLALTLSTNSEEGKMLFQFLQNFPQSVESASSPLSLSDLFLVSSLLLGSTELGGTDLVLAAFVKLQTSLCLRCRRYNVVEPGVELCLCCGPVVSGLRQ